MNKVKLHKEPIKNSSYSIRNGDVILSSNLGEVMFDKWSRGMKSYLCVQISTGTRYKTMVLNAYSHEFNVIGTYEMPTVESQFGNDTLDLRTGDLFTFEDRKGNCNLYRFIQYGRSGKIEACSPMDDTRKWGIDSSFVCVKVESLI